LQFYSWCVTSYVRIRILPAVPANSRDEGLSGGRTAILTPDSKQNYVLRSDYYQEGVHGVFLPGTPGILPIITEEYHAA